MLQINVPNLNDPEIAPMIRAISLLAIQLSDILIVGLAANRPTAPAKKFHWATDTKVLSFYTADATLGGGTGWITITYT